jgi:hypothetical protein
VILKLVDLKKIVIHVDSGKVIATRRFGRYPSTADYGFFTSPHCICAPLPLIGARPSVPVQLTAGRILSAPY